MDSTIFRPDESLDTSLLVVLINRYTEWPLRFAIQSRKHASIHGTVYIQSTSLIHLRVFYKRLMMASAYS